MTPFKPFNFTIPSLPREQYEFIQRVCKAYTLSQRQAVILALFVLEDQGLENKPRVEEFVESVRARHPSRAKPASWLP